MLAPVEHKYANTIEPHTESVGTARTVVKPFSTVVSASKPVRVGMLLREVGTTTGIVGIDTTGSDNVGKATEAVGVETAGSDSVGRLMVVRPARVEDSPFRTKCRNSRSATNVHSNGGPLFREPIVLRVRCRETTSRTINLVLQSTYHLTVGFRALLLDHWRQHSGCLRVVIRL